MTLDNLNRALEQLQRHSDALKITLKDLNQLVVSVNSEKVVGISKKAFKSLATLTKSI